MEKVFVKIILVILFVVTVGGTYIFNQLLHINFWLSLSIILLIEVIGMYDILKVLPRILFSKEV